MSARQQTWANRAKADLIASLGGCCWACGGTALLEIDHPYGRDWKPREKSFSWRVSIYRREAQSGLLRVLCESCNRSNRYNGVELPRPVTLSENEPF